MNFAFSGVDMVGILSKLPYLGEKVASSAGIKFYYTEVIWKRNLRCLRDFRSVIPKVCSADHWYGGPPD